MNNWDKISYISGSIFQFDTVTILKISSVHVKKWFNLNASSASSWFGPNQITSDYFITEKRIFCTLPLPLFNLTLSLPSFDPGFIFIDVNVNVNFLSTHRKCLDPFIFEFSNGHFNRFITYSIQEILDEFGRIPVYNLNTSKSVLGK